MDVITYPCWDKSEIMLVNGATGEHLATEISETRG